MPANQVVYEDPTFRVASRRNVLFTIWSDAPTLDQARTFHREVEAFAKGRGGNGALVNVVVRGVPRFSDGVREELLRVMKNKLLQSSLGVAHVLLIGGLAGATVRAFVSTLMLVARSSAPTRVFGRKDDALAWMMEVVGRGSERWTRGELAEALDEALEGR